MAVERKDDFPLSLALLILGLVGAFLFLGQPILSGELPWETIETFLKRNDSLLISSGVLFIFNISSLIGGLQRWIGFRKQGSRLKTLRGQRLLFTRANLWRLLAGFVAAVFTYFTLNLYRVGELL